MKALSLTQPMAWAVFHGKDVENRTWSTKFRGRIYIHASKKFNRGHYEWIWKNALAIGDLSVLPWSHSFTQGAIIGEVDIVDCVEIYDSPWWMGPYGFILENPEKYEIPISCRGTIFPMFFEPEVFKGG